MLRPQKVLLGGVCMIGPLGEQKELDQLLVCRGRIFAAVPLGARARESADKSSWLQVLVQALSSKGKAILHIFEAETHLHPCMHNQQFTMRTTNTEPLVTLAGLHCFF